MHTHLSFQVPPPPTPGPLPLQRGSLHPLQVSAQSPPRAQAPGAVQSWAGSPLSSPPPWAGCTVGSSGAPCPVAALPQLVGSGLYQTSLGSERFAAHGGMWLKACEQTLSCLRGPLPHTPVGSLSPGPLRAKSPVGLPSETAWALLGAGTVLEAVRAGDSDPSCPGKSETGDGG